MTTLLFLEPGHFHAGLTLKSRNPRVERDVHVYAPAGPELDAFLALVDSFNARANAPTDWRVHVRRSDDALRALVDDRAGARGSQLAVLAGRNDTKLARIAALHAAGIPVLADKPWLVDAAAFGYLDAVTEGPPHAMDIMTSRHDVYARLRKGITTCEPLFGAFARDAGGPPAIELGSVHHLLKVVNGAPLVRAPWYFDTRVQGDGLTDIQSHMTDQAQWLLERAGEDWQLDRDLEMESARLWDTPVPLELYTGITGERAFDETLSGRVRGAELALAANGEICYALHGVRVRQRAEWRQREPADGGDLMSAAVRGTRSQLHVSQGPHTGFAVSMEIQPAAGVTGFEDALRAAVAGWQDAFPGLGFERAATGVERYRLVVPPALDAGHEAHFAMVLDECLDTLERGDWPAALARRLRFRYGLLARAKSVAAS